MPIRHADAHLSNGIRLHVASSGDAGNKLILFIHGFPEFWYAWRHQIPALAAAGYRVVAPDLRGYGASAMPTTGTVLTSFSAARPGSPKPQPARQAPPRPINPGA